MTQNHAAERKDNPKKTPRQEGIGEIFRHSQKKELIDNPISHARFLVWLNRHWQLNFPASDLLDLEVPYPKAAHLHS